MRLTAGCFGRLNMTRKNFEIYRLNQQADNLAKLRQEFLSVTEPIAKIFGAVVAAKPSLALRNGQVIARCGCQNNGIKSGVGVPPNQTTKPTILRNCGRSFCP